MCGIAGAVFWQRSFAEDPHEVVEAMTRTMAHRGPDGHGVCTASDGASSSPAVVLGHRRLSIIDVSDRAAQPMASPRLPVWLVFNGEIYNFRQLRRELESHGRTFRSQSDTEVLLQGYEQWGDAVVQRLRGMFAFAIWDGRTNRLLAARDRVGIKPLYLFRTSRALLFASEISALLASGLVPRRLNVAALDEYGWGVQDPYDVAATPESYLAFVQQSTVELGIAKSGYVLSRSGWFSDRSTRYLASGKPVLVQDTGFSEHLPVGEGLVPFRTLEEAVRGAESILAEVPQGRSPSDALLDVGWMIEELRVSLFAQSLGTPRPVSVKRVHRAMDNLQD